MGQKRYLTGIKATGLPHLGNYFGAIRPAINFSQEQEDDLCLYFIADYHALTSVRNAKEYRQYVYEVAATWLASGLDPKKVVFYKQSDIPAIFELTWILACHTPKGDMNRAHAFKAAVSKNEEKKTKDLEHGINAGLFNYPLLMAADILLFDTNFVPVGKDQVQHVEMARSMAQRINQLYGECLVEPQEVIPKEGLLLPGLDGQKMSKSYNNHIPLFAPEKRLKKLVNKITTDSSEPGEPKETKGSLIFDIFCAFGNQAEIEDLSKQYAQGISWGEAKAVLFERLNKDLAEKREVYEHYMAHTDKLDEILAEGKVKANELAAQTMQRVRSKIIGF
jgi:tryptophanyl-tRNA synthetase